VVATQRVSTSINSGGTGVGDASKEGGSYKKKRKKLGPYFSLKDPSSGSRRYLVGRKPIEKPRQQKSVRKEKEKRSIMHGANVNSHGGMAGGTKGEIRELKDWENDYRRTSINKGL